MKFPIEDFINKYQDKNNQMPNMFNNNFNNNFPNMGMNNNFMPNMIGMNINFNNNNEEWLKGFQMGVENKDDRKKMNVIFKAAPSGTTTTLTLKYGTTIDKMLEKYLNRIGRPELYGDTSRIVFLYNSYKIRFGDQTPIEELFAGNMNNPRVVLNDVNSIIGGLFHK